MQACVLNTMLPWKVPCSGGDFTPYVMGNKNALSCGLPHTHYFQGKKNVVYHVPDLIWQHL